ncbi:hypothetical protein ACIA5D_14095 [Actinoplanes sp. NPDC051513]|uniref:hypothetical protein n=1 Tax=Actinoplanes sp. NPDC051513 TaxID=3363908 RepID=UPI0037996F2B
MSNDSNGPVQEPGAGPWGNGSAEVPPQPAPGWNAPQQAGPSAAPAWPAEPGSPAPGVWHGQAPVSGQPAQYGTPQPGQYGPPQQGWTPYQPVSGQPGPSSQPISGSASWSESVAPPTEPIGQWPPPQAAVGDEGPSWRPRIEPSPPSRGRFLPGLLVGLLVGLVVLAPAGYFVGDLLFGDEPKAGGTTGEPAPVSTALPPYEARQAELNRAKFDGDLAAMAEPWLPYLSRCISNIDPGAPKAPKSEITRVTCQLGNMTVFFVEYKTPGDRNKEYLTRQQQNIDTQQLAPGAVPPTHKAGASGSNIGNYVEFAFKPQAAGAETYAGIWWDRDGAPLVAARIEVPWAKGLNQNWEPLRDIWQRHG